MADITSVAFPSATESHDATQRNRIVTFTVFEVKEDPLLMDKR